MFIPTDVQGLFFWIHAASITGVSNGGPITFIPDLSGSGNYLTNSGTHPAPTYNTNILNGLPVMHFNGLGGYFQTPATGVGATGPTHSPSLEVSPSSLSIYSVYRVNNVNSQQTILVNESGSTALKPLWRNFGIGTNYNNGTYVTPSSWYYTWGSGLFGAGNTNFITAKSSGDIGSNLYSSGEWVIRSDLFTTLQTDSGVNLFFGKDYTTIRASSIASLPSEGMFINNVGNINTSLYVGYSNLDNSVGFDGDIAEIIAYNINTIDVFSSSGEGPLHNIIIRYLSQKYAIGGSNFCTLYLAASGTTFTANQSTTLYEGSTVGMSSPVKPLYIGSSQSVSGNIPLFITNNPTNSISLFIGSTVSSSSSIPLCVGSTLTNFSTIPLYTSGAFYKENGIPLWTAGNFHQFPPITLYMKGGNTSTYSVPLFTFSSTGSSGNFPLYMASGVGHAPPLPTGGGPSPYLPLYILSKHNPTITGYKTLFTFAGSTLVCQTSGYGHGLNYFSQNYFGIHNFNNRYFGETSLQSQVCTSLDGYYRGTSLYMKGGGPQVGLPLFLKQGGIEPTPSSILPLYILVPTTSGITYSSTTLFVGNYGASSGHITKLYINGLGELDGGLVDQAGMPLFINRPNTNVVSMFTLGSEDPHEAIPLYISGVLTSSRNVPLYVGGSIRNSGNVPLFISTLNAPTGFRAPAYFASKYFAAQYFDVDYWNMGLDGSGSILGVSGGLSSTSFYVCGY